MPFLKSNDFIKKKIYGKEMNKMLLSSFSNVRTTRFDQSSPVHPVLKSRELRGSLIVTKKQRSSRTVLPFFLILDVRGEGTEG